MMTKQSTALRLVEVAPYLENGEKGTWIVQACDELRRLHEENQKFHESLSLAIWDRLEVERLLLTLTGVKWIPKSNTPGAENTKAE